MAERIVNGYLIKRINYDLFDEILTFITEDGEKFITYAAGTRRITSKNARSLFFGNYLEIQYFPSRIQSKMSRLKKVIAIDRIDYEIENKYSLLIISNLLSNIEDFNKDYYYLYQMVLQLLLTSFNDLLISCFILVKFMIMNGIYFNFSNCIDCGTNKLLKTIDLSNHGVVCAECFSRNEHLKEYNIEALKLWKKLFNAKDVVNIEFKNENTLKGLLKILNLYVYENLGIYIDFIAKIK